LKKYGVKLGFMSFFLKAATLALQEYPVVNSVIDGAEIVRRNYTDISVAVATPTGLMVPVIRNTHTLKFHELEQKMGEFAKKGKERKISIEDMQGGTFTISQWWHLWIFDGYSHFEPSSKCNFGHAFHH
jgi:2-oxoglutarate dehydrogenase E2 component (dihydrolipoamide succinyltransferase)